LDQRQQVQNFAPMRALPISMAANLPLSARFMMANATAHTLKSKERLSSDYLSSLEQPLNR
jgi:hypothetical protein